MRSSLNEARGTEAYPRLPKSRIDSGSRLLPVLLLAFPLLLSALPAPAAGGTSPTAPVGISLTVTSSHYKWWCSSENSSIPSLNLSSLNGAWIGTTWARACPAHKGQAAAGDSYAITEGNLLLKIPVLLNSSNKGVQVGWDLRVKASTRTAYGLPVAGCPVFSTISTRSNSSTTFTSSFQNQWCDVEAVVDVRANASLIDLTSGAVYRPLHGWGGIHLACGTQIITYRWTGNYSNQSYWGQNYSYLQSLNYTFTNASSIAGSFLPTWFMNGSFRASDRYAVQIYLNESMAAESFLFFSGVASAHLNGATGPRHENLVAPTVY